MWSVLQRSGDRIGADLCGERPAYRQHSAIVSVGLAAVARTDRGRHIVAPMLIRGGEQGEGGRLEKPEISARHIVQALSYHITACGKQRHKSLCFFHIQQKGDIL